MGRLSPRNVFVFFALACGITWGLTVPAVLAWVRHLEPPMWAVSLVALSAFGPTIAAVMVARPARSAFGPWRTRPIWIVAALFTPMALQLVAKLIEVMLGGHVSTWVCWPSAPEHMAALVIFSIGEEFGWRGFAQPRLVARYGPVVGALMVGTAWAVWHSMYCVSPETGRIDWLSVMLMPMYPLYSIVFVWFMQRAGGSMAIAIALHAGGHLDSVARLPPDELRLRVITLLVIAAASVLAARSLLKTRR